MKLLLQMGQLLAASAFVQAGTAVEVRGRHYGKTHAAKQYYGYTPSEIDRMAAAQAKRERKAAQKAQQCTASRKS